MYLYAVIFTQRTTIYFFQVQFLDGGTIAAGCEVRARVRRLQIACQQSTTPTSDSELQAPSFSSAFEPGSAIIMDRPGDLGASDE